MASSTEERQRGGVATGLVEYQMRFREIVSRAARGAAEVPVAPRPFGPFLAISREAGSGGAEVARRVGERLGWPVLDRELVNGLAEDLKLEPRVLELMDETRSNWFSETLLNLLNSRLVLQHSYVDLVGKVMALAASAGPVVVVGRGSNLILPPDCGLRVRIIAPREARIAATAHTEGLEERAAAKRVDEIDGNRQDFIRRHFKVDAADPTLYDLVVNTGTFGIAGSVELVVRSLELRCLSNDCVSSQPSAG